MFGIVDAKNEKGGVLEKLGSYFDCTRLRHVDGDCAAVNYPPPQLSTFFSRLARLCDALPVAGILKMEHRMLNFPLRIPHS